MQEEDKTVIDKIEIKHGDNTSQYIPKNAGTFVDHGDMLKAIALGVRDNMSVLIVGESGTGKTSAIRFLASKTGNGLRRVNLNGGTTADELVGRMLINDKGTYWVDGVLTEAMRHGEWIVLDEINAALPEVLFVLQSIMDDDGYLVLNEKDDKEIVYKHPNFRLFATCNPPEYAGTKEMNKALLSRFGICISAEFPPEKIEMDIIAHHLGNAISASEMAVKLVGMANETRKSKEVGNTEYAINTRDVLNTLRLVQSMEPQEALSLAFANKLDQIDKKAIQSLAKLHLPTNKKSALAQRIAITKPEELIINNKYVINADMHSSYLGLTKDKVVVAEMKKKNLGDIIQNSQPEGSIKGEEFVIEGTFYENGNAGCEDTEQTTLGDKAASLIKFVTGPHKENSAVLLHHKDLGDSIKVINNLYEIR